MRYRELNKNIFALDGEYALMQCVSADFDMSTGVTARFNEKFDLRNKLVKKYHGNLVRQWDKNPYGYCIHEPVSNTLNLVVGRDRFMERDNVFVCNLRAALYDTIVICKMLNIKRVAISADDFNDDKEHALEILRDVLKNTDMELLICTGII